MHMTASIFQKLHFWFDVFSWSGLSLHLCIQPLFNFILNSLQFNFFPAVLFFFFSRQLFCINLNEKCFFFLCFNYVQLMFSIYLLLQNGISVILNTYISPKYWFLAICISSIHLAAVFHARLRRSTACISEALIMGSENSAANKTVSFG